MVLENIDKPSHINLNLRFSHIQIILNGSALIETGVRPVLLQPEFRIAQDFGSNFDKCPGFSPKSPGLPFTLRSRFMTPMSIQWKPVIRTSSGVETNVLITGMFL